MRVVKLGLISVAVLFIVVTLISLLLPSRIIISRAIDINADRDSVYEHIANFSRWNSWYPAADTTSFLASSFAGEGAALKVDKATIAIKSITPDKISLLWIEGATGEVLPAEINFIGKRGDSKVTVQWQFVHTVKWYPWEKFASIVSNQTIGSFMELALDNLKQQCEQ